MKKNIKMLSHPRILKEKDTDKTTRLAMRKKKKYNKGKRRMELGDGIRSLLEKAVYSDKDH